MNDDAVALAFKKGDLILQIIELSQPANRTSVSDAAEPISSLSPT